MLQAGQPANRKNTSTTGPLAVRPLRVRSPPSTSLRTKGSTTSPTLIQAAGSAVATRVARWSTLIFRAAGSQVRTRSASDRPAAWPGFLGSSDGLLGLSGFVGGDLDRLQAGALEDRAHAPVLVAVGRCVLAPAGVAAERAQLAGRQGLLGGDPRRHLAVGPDEQSRPDNATRTTGRSGRSAWRAMTALPSGPISSTSLGQASTHVPQLLQRSSMTTSIIRPPPPGRRPARRSATAFSPRRAGARRGRILAGRILAPVHARLSRRARAEALLQRPAATRAAASPRAERRPALAARVPGQLGPGVVQPLDRSRQRRPAPEMMLRS